MRKILAVTIVQALLVAAFGIALRSGSMPLGVRGEWEWLRLTRGVTLGGLELATGLLAVTAYAAFVWAGMRFLSTKASRPREWLAVGALWAAAAAAQMTMQAGAPEGYGLSKWTFALYDTSASGYFKFARSQLLDPWRFLAAYPTWIRHQDAFHIGTHPPGLFLTSYLLRSAMHAEPEVAHAIVNHVPSSVEAGFMTISVFDPLSRPDRATLALTGFLTLLACSATVIPLYLLARAFLDAPTAWSAATLWPLLPSAILFQPTADTAFPLLSTTALSLAVYAGRVGARAGIALAFAGGVVLAFGMWFTLAFLAVGLIVAIVLLAAGRQDRTRQLVLILATGAGFLSLTLLAWMLTRANPFAIWWWNQQNHSRFYVAFPRSFAPWIVANTIELAIAIGLPASLWCALGLWRAGEATRSAWATLCVLAILTLSGKNLSEAARIWLPMMPPLLVAAGHGLTRVGGGPGTLAATVVLVGLETLVLQSTIQVVYPV